jgi:hypothetical protein
MHDNIVIQHVNNTFATSLSRIKSFCLKMWGFDVGVWWGVNPSCTSDWLNIDRESMSLRCFWYWKYSPNTSLLFRLFVFQFASCLDCFPLFLSNNLSNLLLCFTKIYQLYTHDEDILKRNYYLKSLKGTEYKLVLYFIYIALTIKI